MANAMWKMTLIALVAILGIGSRTRMAHAAVYANITDVVVEELRNAVQITVKADGVLESRGDQGGGYGQRIFLRFPGARSQVGKSYIDVNKFPVGGILLAVPQDAPEGIGIEMTVLLLTPCSYTVRESPDQQSVLITVNSERSLERNAGGPTTGAPVVSSMDVRLEEGLLTVRAVKADIHGLLGRVSEVAKIDIAVDDQVSRIASLNLERLPVDEVMRGIASAYGLALSHINGIYMISKGVPDDLAAYRLSGTQSFRMKYIQADTASGLLPSFLFQYVHRNSEQNAVVVTAPTQMLEKIGADLKKVDVAPPMILIEALAVEINSTRDLETALGLQLRDRSVEPPADGKKTNPTTGLQFDSETGVFTYRQVAALPHNFAASLRALEESGRARVRANPRMAAVNGKTADLFIGNQKFIEVLYTPYGGQQQTRIQTVDVGVKLQVTPWTGGNGEITVRLEPEVSNIVEMDPITGLPVLSKRSCRTSVRVKDGETIILGGLRQKQESRVQRRVPVLGSLPIVGTLFRSQVAHELETELVFFITPHVLTETGHLPDAAEEQRVRERLLPSK